MLRFLFPYTAYSTKLSSLILVVRMLFGGLMMWHGIGKIINFAAIVATYPNPVGLGSRATLYVAIFTEVFCAAGVVLGAFYRLALIPLIGLMGVAFLMVHHGDAFAAKELALIFFVMYVVMFVAGAGRYSLDEMIASMIHQKEPSPQPSDEALTTRPQDSAPQSDDAPRR